MEQQPVVELGMAQETPLHVAEPGADEGGQDQQRDHPKGEHVLIDEHAGQDQQAVAGQKGGGDEAILQHQKRQ